MKPFGFPSRFRIRRGSDFQRIYDGRLKAGDDVLLVFGQPNQLGFTRMGLSVSRKNGNAVQRARKKRLLREAFRLERERLPVGWDLVLIPRFSQVATLAAYRKSLRKQAQRVVRRATADGAENTSAAHRSSPTHLPTREARS